MFKEFQKKYFIQSNVVELGYGRVSSFSFPFYSSEKEIFELFGEIISRSDFDCYLYEL